MRNDMNSNVAVVSAVAPQVLAATNTSGAIDLAGFDAALIVIPTGAIVGDGDFTAKLQESDTSVSGDFADVAATDLVGSFPASLAADSAVKIGYRGGKRYVRTVITKNSGTSIAAAVVVVKGAPHVAPVA